ncbi:MAG: alanine--tRNA ligase, partial [Clostridiales bacterium]
VKDSLGDYYPELVREEENVVRAIRMEEERFHQTLKAGMNITHNMISKMREEGRTEISGTDLFMLYDTFGFPLDLAKDIAEENGLTIDEAGFTAAMQEQREKSQSARSDQGSEDQLLQLGQLLVDVKAGKFLGYQQLCASGKIIALAVNGKSVEKIQAGDSGWLALDQTPFYGESGGQVGDTGTIGSAAISDTQKLPNGLFVHCFHLEQGELNIGEQVEASVDPERRMAISRNHSATHLLHRALRMTLGEHLHQAGSQVNQERLRFDYNHFAPVGSDDLQKIEDEVNKQILANLPIKKEEMALEDAKATGAMAFFGDKYGETVRLVSMGDFSRELCGGTHCDFTGQLGCIKILSESGIGAGMRRIEAVTGTGAIAYYQQQEEKLTQLANLLKTTPADAERRLEQILSENKAFSRELEKLRAQLTKDSMEDVWRQAEKIQDVAVLCVNVPSQDMGALRNTVDILRDKLDDYVIVAASATEEKVQFVVAVSEKARSAGCHAGEIIKEVAAVCGGKGGGRADMAQAGGKDKSPEKIAQALTKARQLIADKLQ